MAQIRPPWDEATERAEAAEDTARAAHRALLRLVARDGVICEQEREVIRLSEIALGCDRAAVRATSRSAQTVRIGVASLRGAFDHAERLRRDLLTTIGDDDEPPPAAMAKAA